VIELISCKISNFKSLDNFRIAFSKFTCLIGLNSAGKSTILQAIDFISAQMRGDISGWLTSREWDATKINSTTSSNFDIIVDLTFSYKNKLYRWTFVYMALLEECNYESIRVVTNITNNSDNKVLFQVINSKFTIEKDGEIKDGEIIQKYAGSFLAKLKPELLPDVIVELRDYLQNIHSLDLLSPKELKKESRDGQRLGLSGENLSSFLHDFNTQQKQNILTNLQKCYPNIKDYMIRPTANGYYKLEITENFQGKSITNEAKYLNDGILRMIAIFAQLETSQRFLLFDEIENGINSELIEYLLDILIASKHQIIITTHSPMILNYMDDEVAKKSIQYIYKTLGGATKSIPFFEIPSMAEKLEMMGAGSAYVDTNLAELVDEIEIVQKQREEQ